MRVTSLASGSSGNAFLVEAGSTRVLIDAGITLAGIGSGLAHYGLTPADLSCVLLTHEHSDHLCSARSLSRRYFLPLAATAGTLSHLAAHKGEQMRLVPGVGFALDGLAITPFSIPHDGLEPVGYLLEHEGTRACLATDLGHVPEELLSVFRSCDLLILEANHDEDRLWCGPYPRPLKRRVAAPTGHLSNEQTAECLVKVGDGGPRWVWLAHLSSTNNSPRCALETVSARLNREQIGGMQVGVALRDRPSLRWDSAEAFCQGKLL
ncbi:MAG: MBL fold metallo-hydrolase [Dehalococcoidales bacterium]|nr:MBL fold metallo-hydrolase [Dehalococcoidales bacterium]